MANFACLSAVAVIVAILQTACAQRGGSNRSPSPPVASSPPPSPPPPSPPPSPNFGSSPSATQNAKGLFPLSATDEALLEKYCNGKVNNPNFYPCPVQGACSDCSKACTPKTPRSCDAPRTIGTKDCVWGGGPNDPGYGCGKNVIIKFAQGNINSCNTGPGFGSSQGNTNSNANSQATYYCAQTSATASECCALCKKYENGGVPGNPEFKCRTWTLIAPNDAKENSKCDERTNPRWIEQGGANQSVVTPYYGGCGWCFLLPSEQCAPTCSAWGLYQDNNDKKNNIYWALYGRMGCSSGKNDPHFEGAEGTRFEFNGLPDQSFCLVTDDNLHINMKMHGYYDERTVGASILKDGKAVRTWMRELAIMWKSADESGVMQKHSLHLVARSGAQQEYGEGFLAKAVVDGEEIPRMAPGDSVTYPSGLTLTFGGKEKYGPYDMDKYVVSIAGLLQLGLKIRLAHPLLQTPQDAEAHFNVMFDSIKQTPNIHGVIGQTYRAGRTLRALEYRALSALLGHPVAADGNSGLGYLDGTTADYVSSSVLAADCKFSAFS